MQKALLTIILLVSLASPVHAVETYLIQFGEMEFVPCEHDDTGTTALAVLCWNSPTILVCDSLDCVREKIRVWTASHVFKIECMFAPYQRLPICEVQELKIIKTVDVVE